MGEFFMSPRHSGLFSGILARDLPMLLLVTPTNSLVHLSEIISLLCHRYRRLNEYLFFHTPPPQENECNIGERVRPRRARFCQGNVTIDICLPGCYESNCLWSTLPKPQPKTSGSLACLGFPNLVRICPAFGWNVPCTLCCDMSSCHGHARCLQVSFHP